MNTNQISKTVYTVKRKIENDYHRDRLPIGTKLSSLPTWCKENRISTSTIYDYIRRGYIVKTKKQPARNTVTHYYVIKSCQIGNANINADTIIYDIDLFEEQSGVKVKDYIKIKYNALALIYDKDLPFQDNIKLQVKAMAKSSLYNSNFYNLTNYINTYIDNIK